MQISSRDYFFCKQFHYIIYFWCVTAIFCNFRYTIPIFKKGRKRELNLDDVYRIPESFASKRLGDALEKTKELMSIDEKSVSLKKLLWKHYAKTYFFLGVLQLIVRTSIMYVSQRNQSQTHNAKTNLLSESSSRFFWKSSSTTSRINPPFPSRTLTSTVPL